jgi:hypothetical protein
MKEIRCTHVIRCSCILTAEFMIINITFTYNDWFCNMHFMDGHRCSLCTTRAPICSHAPCSNMWALGSPIQIELANHVFHLVFAARCPITSIGPSFDNRLGARDMCCSNACHSFFLCSFPGQNKDMVRAQKSLYIFFKPPQHPAFLGILITKCCIASLELRYERIGSGLGFQIVIWVVSVSLTQFNPKKNFGTFCKRIAFFEWPILDTLGWINLMAWSTFKTECVSKFQYWHTKNTVASDCVYIRFVFSTMLYFCTLAWVMFICREVSAYCERNLHLKFVRLAWSKLTTIIFRCASRQI